MFGCLWLLSVLGPRRSHQFFVFASECLWVNGARIYFIIIIPFLSLSLFHHHRHSAITNTFLVLCDFSIRNYLLFFFWLKMMFRSFVLLFRPDAAREIHVYRILFFQLNSSKPQLRSVELQNKLQSEKWNSKWNRTHILVIPNDYITWMLFHSPQPQHHSTSYTIADSQLHIVFVHRKWKIYCQNNFIIIF